MYFQSVVLIIPGAWRFRAAKIVRFGQRESCPELLKQLDDNLADKLTKF